MLDKIRFVENYRTFITEHYIFNYKENTKAAQDIQKIAAHQETCYSHICKVLKISPDFKIHYFLCDSPEEVGVIYGDNEPCNGFADAPDKIYAVYNEDIQCIGYHEDAHILSYIIHRPNCTALREGLAMFFDQTWWDIPNLSWTKYFLENNKYIAIDKIFQESIFNTNDCSVTYPIVGAFTQWLIDSYGIAQYLRFYRQQDIVAATQTIYQKTLAELNQSFIDDIRKHEIDPLLQNTLHSLV